MANPDISMYEKPYEPTEFWTFWLRHILQIHGQLGQYLIQIPSF